jgi:hypothetical protein
MKTKTFENLVRVQEDLMRHGAQIGNWKLVLEATLELERLQAAEEAE